jgi:CheY-like chemotaxis protein
MYRVLIVDDSEPWRRWLCSAIEANDRWLLVAEAADGASAVEQARALRPDLILLDVTLPSLDGIEAAQRILGRESRLENPVSERALLRRYRRCRASQSAPAATFVKADAGGELLTAMEAVVDGRSFTSRSVTSTRLSRIVERAPSRNRAARRDVEPERAR